jgi:hypothetical protein
MAKKRDYGLILSLGILIAAGSYWIVKELPTEKFDYYLDLLGQRLVELVPAQNDKEQLSAKYDQLKDRVKEKEIEPENLEKMAAAIINLSNARDTLSLKEAELLIEIALDSVAEVENNRDKLIEADLSPEKWENLHNRLGIIDELDKKLEHDPVISGPRPDRNYRVDNRLNIIIDSRERKKLENEEFIRKLEEEKRVVWMHDMVENLKKDLQTMEKELAQKKNIYTKDIDLKQLKVLVQPVIDRGIMIIDSLKIVSDISWDSLEKKVEDELERENRAQKLIDPAKTERIK